MGSVQVDVPVWVDDVIRYRGPCDVCGLTDARHRRLDEIARLARLQGAERIARDYEYPVEFVQRVADEWEITNEVIVPVEVSAPGDLNALAKEIHDTAVEKGWWTEPRSVGDVLALVHSEVSEALEAFRSTGSTSEVWFREGDGKPEGFLFELADVIIRVLDAAAEYGLDIDGAVADKMMFNRSRPHRHGGKHL